MNYTVKIAQKD